MRGTLVMMAVVGLVGCATVDRTLLTQMEPQPGGFRYIAKTDIFHKVGDPDAEKQRIEWMEQYIRDNRLCPAGYDITDRNAIEVNSNISTIYYTGRCR